MPSTSSRIELWPLQSVPAVTVRNEVPYRFTQLTVPMAGVEVGVVDVVGVVVCEVVCVVVVVGVEVGVVPGRHS